jgi:Ser/Thr protein kinase RdoA (MazF antagonist)
VIIIITRENILQLIDKDTLLKIQSLWSMKSYNTTMYLAHDGCQNIVYHLTNGVDEYVLRISFREDRSFAQLQAETHFVDYLHNNGARVAYPIKSQSNCFVEPITLGDTTIYVVVFTKAKGIRLVENNYRYRDGVPVEEYYHNYGKALGMMHRLNKKYVPINYNIIRPTLIDSINDYVIPKYLLKDQIVLRNKFDLLIKQANELPKDNDSYGLLHADFGDSNFTIDYDNGNITTFDFDDASYCWFMYDIADAWTKGFGWAMFEDTAEKRKAKMDNWYNKVLEGYFTENTISDYWLEKLPFFIKLVEMEWVLGEFLDAFRSGGEMEYDDEEILFKLKCIKEEIPYFGLYHGMYNYEKPFCLEL